MGINRLGRAGLALLGSGALAATVVLASGAGASAQQPGATKAKTESFVIGGSEGHEVFVAHGVFTDGGKDTTGDTIDYDVLHLKDGTLRLTHPDKDAHFVPKINPKTCYVTFTETGKYTIGHGTGSFKKVTGKGSYKASGYGLLTRKKSGKCDFNATPKAEVFLVKGSGPITGI